MCVFLWIVHFSMFAHAFCADHTFHTSFPPCLTNLACKVGHFNWCSPILLLPERYLTSCIPPEVVSALPNWPKFWQSTTARLKLRWLFWRRRLHASAQAVVTWNCCSIHPPTARVFLQIIFNPPVFFAAFCWSSFDLIICYSNYIDTTH